MGLWDGERKGDGSCGKTDIPRKGENFKRINQNLKKIFGETKLNIMSDEDRKKLGLKCE